LQATHKFIAWLRHGAFHLPATVFAGFFLFGLLSRMVLLVISWGEIDRAPGELWSVFARGFVFDLAAAAYAAAVVALFSVLLGNRLGAARAYRWVRYVQYALLAFLLIFVLAAEVTFWLEFGVRFNFIAVDYLVYTQEVIGNIVESYPLAPILLGVGAVAAAIAWIVGRLWLPVRYQPTPLRTRAAAAACAVLAAVALFNGFDGGLKERSGNAYNNELASNGVYSFFQAYRLNELSFGRFYKTLAEEQVEHLVQHEIDEASGGASAAKSSKESVHSTRVQAGGAPKRLNVVLIMVESLSADYLGVFGNKKNLTPKLDKLAQESLLFTDLYAVGTRTVRGLEALSAALPPLPGQSIVRRPENGHLFTLGSVLREHGYETKFIYGGFGYFDNMNAYFAANGYQLIDRSSMPREKVGFANIWGVADEYLLDRTLEEIDASHANGKPIFAHVMTTSNHRPYTYPAGRIDIASKSGRNGAVKYTDYAIGRFIEQARTKPWFDDTLFVVIADHCASSAGKERLAIPKYHIPALVYAPKHVNPGRFERLASQIDVAPTLLGMLQMSYPSMFLGHDLLRSEHEEQRAFISNYQEIGYLRLGDDGIRRLVVFAPKKRVSVYRVAADGESLSEETGHAALVQEALGYYQGADYLMRHRLYRDDVRAGAPGPNAQAH
jgi:phosphoglycerol transferase MdoB-like AlkP superfamily enzyme